MQRKGWSTRSSCIAFCEKVPGKRVSRNSLDAIVEWPRGMSRWLQAFLLEVSLVSGSEHRLERGAFTRHLCHEFLDEDTLAIFEARRAC